MLLALCLAICKICLGEARQFNNVSSFPHNSFDAFWDQPNPRLRAQLNLHGCVRDHQRILDTHQDALQIVRMIEVQTL
jgi:hypothetical protein